MRQKIYQVDSFTSEPFSGNPAGVCVMDDAAPVEWMKAVASEMNLSETAFLYPTDDGYNLRWFTPEAEVDLCGHATLASAHILWEQGYLPVDRMARFDTRSGLLTAELTDGWIKLNFPSRRPEAAPPPSGLLEALGVSAVFVGACKATYIVEVESAPILRDIAPDFSSLAKLPVRGVIVTARSDNEEYDFISRYFAPDVGINEDPVTGSAHCCLGPYWMDRLVKTDLRAYQASKRGGRLRVQVEGNRVYLFGQAVTVFELEMR
ncbi:MAG: PhzF family phenazine biosynthesis protein [Candidatus Zixiibacteriota bacterium]